MADFQGIHSPNIATGWSPEPQLSAPNIGGLVEAILKNRLGQQALTQSSISDAIKAYQGRQSDQAYIQAAQNAGVLPQGDYSGMTAAQAANLAQRIQDMTPDTDEDKLKQAMAAHYGAATNKENTIADYIKQYGKTPGARGGAAPDDTPQTYIDDYGREWRLGTGGHWFLVPKGQSKQAMDAQANAAPSLDEQTITPDEPAPPPPNPDVTITPPPQTSGAPPSDTAAGHASTYGVAPSRDAARPGQAYRAPDGSIRTRGND